MDIRPRRLHADVREAGMLIICIGNDFWPT